MATQMRIEPASPAAVLAVASRMRERDQHEFMATSYARTSDELAQDMVRRYAGLPGAICALDGTDPVAIGAMIEARPNVLTLLFFATNEMPRIAISLTSFITKRLFPPQREAGVHRIECVSIIDHTDAHRWIKILGLKQEATMPGYGKGGETFFQFAWTAPDVR
ncbi:hypothetical protein [Bosea lathyri]|nr:hypothetical protein [Bosea lathyri]